MQRVNPNAQVLLHWTGDWNNPTNEEQAVQSLKSEHVDILTYHQNGATIPNAAERAGIPFIAFNETYPSHSYCLAAISINWKSAYLDILRRYRRQSSYANYGAGIAQNMVDVELVSPNATSKEKVLLNTAKWEIQHGRLIFSGEIYDRYGVKRCGENEAISLQYLQNDMNWLVKGVRIVGN